MPEAHENLSCSSTQSHVYLTGVTSGAKISVKSDTTTLAEYTADRALSYLTIFAPGITSGQRYSVSAGGSASTVTAGTGGGRNMGDGFGRR